LGPVRNRPRLPSLNPTRTRRGRPVNPGIVARVIGSVAVIGVLAGCGPTTTAEPPPSTSAVASPTTSAAPAITDIPAEAFLQTKDLGKRGYFVEQGIPSNAISPCRQAPLRSDAMKEVREEVVGTYSFVARYDKINKQFVPDGTVNEVITAYRAGGASAYLNEVREQIARCATEVIDDVFETYTVPVTWTRTIVAEGFAADESLIWRRKSSGVYIGRRHETNELIAVMRLGDVVVLVHIGLSPGLPMRDPIDRLAAAAARRAKDHLPA
jgi:hypothetical protein